MGKVIVGGADLSDLVGIPYVASRHPGNVSVDEFLKNPKLGCNCQLLVLGALKKAGFYIPSDIRMDEGERFGSQELWADREWTETIFTAGIGGSLLGFHHYRGRPFDIFFFSPIEWSGGRKRILQPNEYKRIHVAVYIGKQVEFAKGRGECILHNATPGPSKIEVISFIAGHYYLLLGVKRPVGRYEKQPTGLISISP